MKLNTYKKSNESKVFNNIPKLKKLLKSIKIENSDKCIDEILNRPNQILGVISEGFGLEYNEDIYIKCVAKCNLPVEFSAEVGREANCWIIGEKPNGETLYATSDREGLIEILESIERLPPKIIFNEIELHQRIMNSESFFKYKLNA